MIQNLAEIGPAPIDFDLIERAGEPGTAGRVAVFHALEIISRRPCYRHAGRGPVDFDWLGFMREVAILNRASMVEPMDVAGDALGYRPDHGLPFAVACEVVASWGLEPFDHFQRPCRPGDFVVYDMPGAHGAVLISDEARGPARTGWAPPAGAQALVAQASFGRPPALAWYAAEQRAIPQQWFTWGAGR